MATVTMNPSAAPAPVAAASRAAQNQAPARGDEAPRRAPEAEPARNTVQISAQARQLQAQDAETVTRAAPDDQAAQRSAELRRAYNVQG